MYCVPEKLRTEISACLDQMGVDPSNCVDVAKAYCVCQQINRFIDEKSVTVSSVHQCVSDKDFLHAMRAYELDPIEYSAKSLTCFCSLIRKLKFQGRYAMAFYYHYLPCMIADAG